MRLSKKIAAVAIAAGVALTATAAFAYWSSSGAGDGSGNAAGSSDGTLVLKASVPAGVLAPGGSVTVGYTAQNTSTQTDLQVGTVHAVVSTGVGGCDPAWFSIADVVENQTIPHSSGDVALAHSGTLFFNNAVADQNLCKGATISLALTS